MDVNDVADTRQIQLQKKQTNKTKKKDEGKVEKCRKWKRADVTRKERPGANARNGRHLVQ